MFRPLEVIIRLALEHFKVICKLHYWKRDLSSSNVAAEVVQKVKTLCAQRSRRSATNIVQTWPQVIRTSSKRRRNFYVPHASGAMKK